MIKWHFPIKGMRAPGAVIFAISGMADLMHKFIKVLGVLENPNTSY